MPLRQNNRLCHKHYIWQSERVWLLKKVLKQTLEGAVSTSVLAKYQISWLTIALLTWLFIIYRTSGNKGLILSPPFRFHWELVPSNHFHSVDSFSSDITQFSFSDVWLIKKTIIYELWMQIWIKKYSLQLISRFKSNDLPLTRQFDAVRSAVLLSNIDVRTWLL